MNIQQASPKPAIEVDPARFDRAGIDEETRSLNAGIVERLSSGPDMWSFTPAEIRAARAAGRGFFPLLPPDPDVETIGIPGPAGPIGARIIRPKTRAQRGVYLHFHGGGWMIGEARENDQRLRRHAENTGLATISVDYRLAPEHPHPAGPDDCEAAALWLLSDAAAGLDRSFLAIGGESAGAHLSLATLIRLRDRHGLTPFSAANLVAGIYDLAMTPSVRNWGEEKLILATRDISRMIDHFLSGGGSAADPDVSPLHADLAGLPAALVTCGSLDLLIDDSLFLAARLAAAGNRARLSVHNGGCHVFQAFPTAMAERSLAEMDAFLNAEIARRRG
jgi:acetyl esterase